MLNKKLQRKFCRVKLSELSKKEIDDYSDIIAHKLNEFVEDHKILSYYPLENEVNILSFNNAKHTAYPVIKTDGFMSFYYPRDNKFIKNIYNIPEPDITCSQEISPNEYRYIIVPLLGFDKKLNRLGHGKGYYDRYLCNTNLIKVGIAFDIQKLDDVICDQNDIPLDYVITERCIYKKQSRCKPAL